MSSLDFTKFVPSNSEELPFPEIPVQGHPDYFYPLQLKLNSTDKEAFMREQYPKLFANVTVRKLRLVNLGNFRDEWLNTVTETNYFLKEMKLKVTAINVFVGDKNLTSWSVHKDGTMFEDKPVGLEARLSFYEMAQHPGVIRWWKDEDVDIEFHDNSVNPLYNKQNRFYLMPTWVAAIKNGDIGWKDVPQPDWQTSTNTPSALLRVNRAHHVIQGNGVRVTVGAQVTFMDGNPTGVWQHIRDNIHKVL